MRAQNAISIIVPTYNEADNVGLLANRIDRTMRGADLSYEIIFIDDHSTDGTRLAVKALAADYPVRLYLKQGQKGKSYSLLQGFKKAHYDLLCMIDGDLQYPPEAISRMYRLLRASGADIVITNRVASQTSQLRRFISNAFNFVFARLLFGFRYDTQSGLKLFKKEVIENIIIEPTPWSFDLEFIVRSLEKGYRILSYDIVFSQRHAGEAKINVISNSLEIGWAALKIRFNSSARMIRKSVRRSTKLAQGFGLFLFFASLSLTVMPVKADTISVGPVSITVPIQLQNQPVRPALPETPQQTVEPQPTTAPVADSQSAVQPTASSSQPTVTASMQSTASSQINTTAAPASQLTPLYGAAAPANADSAAYAATNRPPTSLLKIIALATLSAAFVILVALLTAMKRRAHAQRKNV